MSAAQLRRPLAALLALTLAAAASAGAVSADADPAADDRAVIDGGKALDRWWPNGYPWYDAADDRTGGDDIAPIDVSTPWWENLTFNGKWNWSPNLGWLWTTLKYTAWAALAALVAYLVYLIVRWCLDPDYRLAWRRRAAETAQQAAQRRRRTEALPLACDEGPTDLLDAARRAAAAGRYNEAIVYLFSHQLVELDKHRRLHLARGKTNRQYLREIGAAGPLGRLFLQTMVTFEDAFFGRREIGRARFDACYGRLDEFNALALAAPTLVAQAAMPAPPVDAVAAPMSAPMAENTP